MGRTPSRGAERQHDCRGDCGSAPARTPAHPRAPRTTTARAARQAVGASAAAGVFAASGVALANDSVLHPPAYPWTFNGFFNSYDAASIRRGHQVYTQICATCHSLNR